MCATQSRGPRSGVKVPLWNKGFHRKMTYCEKTGKKATGDTYVQKRNNEPQGGGTGLRGVEDMEQGREGSGICKV